MIQRWQAVFLPWLQVVLLGIAVATAFACQGPNKEMAKPEEQVLHYKLEKGDSLDLGPDWGIRHSLYVKRFHGDDLLATDLTYFAFDLDRDGRFEFVTALPVTPDDGQPAIGADLDGDGGLDWVDTPQ
jgi:hypothetical protein